MNYAEFKKSLCRAMWIQDAMLTIEVKATNLLAIPHKHTLFVDDEWGIEAPGCDLHLSWKTIEKMVEEGKVADVPELDKEVIENKAVAVYDIRL